MLEAEYKRNFGLIADQISGATRAFYTYMEINNSRPKAMRIIRR
jgi:hypothetical protein